MGIFFSKAEPPPPMVLVPPLFDYPPLAARTRFSASAPPTPLSELDDPHTFVDLLVSTSNPLLQLRACAYDTKYRIGAFGTLPLLMGNRVHSEDYGVMGLTASFYQHLVVQRRVKNPLEDDQVVGITNYIDFGLELVSRVDKDKATQDGSSLFQLAASWQANKNFLLKGKLGPSKSSVALAFKSWWRPSFTFSVTAVNDHSKGTTSYGFGLRVEDLRQASYQRADPNYVMLTPSKEHLAPGVLRDYGKRPMFQTLIDSGNYDHLPAELKPIGRIL
nr:unnamed protein product [Digitaria exilis]